jgi:hypothetical protein
MYSTVSLFLLQSGFQLSLPPAKKSANPSSRPAHRRRPPRRPSSRPSIAYRRFKDAYGGQLQFSDGDLDTRNDDNLALTEDVEDSGVDELPPVEALMQILTPQGYLPELVKEDLLLGQLAEEKDNSEAYQQPHQKFQLQSQQNQLLLRQQQQNHPLSQQQKLTQNTQQTSQPPGERPFPPEKVQQQPVTTVEQQQPPPAVAGPLTDLTFRLTRLQPVSATLLLGDAAVEQLLRSNTDNRRLPLLVRHNGGGDVDSINGDGAAPLLQASL